MVSATSGSKDISQSRNTSGYSQSKSKGIKKSEEIAG